MSEVLVVGGGVCGLRLAGLLAEQGIPHRLAEARPTLGGRVRTQRYEDPPGYADLGPAWVWPHQPRILTRLRELGLPTFEQYTAGELVFEDREGRVQRHAMATMGGSLRVEGGLVRLVDALAAKLDASGVWLGAQLQRLERVGDEVEATFGDQRIHRSRRVVLAMPPRIAAETIVFDPPLPALLRKAMLMVPTWMAAHAKAVAVYDTPFWRAAGLNGDAISHRGPLGEIHDATPHDETVGALFGFFGTDARWRRAHRDAAESLVLDQLTRLFGDAASRPRSLIIEDWAEDRHVALPDEPMPSGHPTYRPLQEHLGPWSSSLVLSGTELASNEGGYLEGALVAAEDALEAIKANRGHE